MEDIPEDEINNPQVQPTANGNEVKNNIVLVPKEPQIKIKTEEDLEHINVKSERLEICDLKSAKIMEKLRTLQFIKLEILTLNDIGIKSIEFLNNDNFKSLAILELKNNEIESLDKISEAPYQALKILDLSNNKIKSINDISKAPFKLIEIIVLSYNEISDVQPLSAQKLDKLKSWIYQKIK